MAETERELVARAGISTWFEHHHNQEAGHRRSQIETAKLIVTFALAVAATLVATALQVDPRGKLDVVAVVVLGFAFLGALGTIMLDRTASPNADAVEAESRRSGWDGHQLLAALGAAHRQAEDWNRYVVVWVHRSTTVTVLLVTIAGSLGAISLLIK